MLSSSTLSNFIHWLFATNTQQTMWYITRSAGWVSYILVWFSTVWGLALPIKMFKKWLSPTFTFEFHQFLSLLAIGFLALHVGVLLLDKYLPFSLAQILFPFFSTYRPLWVGLGIIAAYLTLLVTITFYMRSRIGMKTFKSIHLLSFVAYIGATLHGFFSGTDSSLTAAMALYLSTFLVVVFLTTYWIIEARLNKKEPQRQLRPAPVRVEAQQSPLLGPYTRTNRRD